MDRPDSSSSSSTVDRWAALRFSVIGGLLASPPEPGQLAAAVAGLADKRYRHPMRAEDWVTFSASTIERWYYRALHAGDAMAALARQVRSDIGHHWAMSPGLHEALDAQYRLHPRWSYKLHFDNLVAVVQTNADLGPMPSYATVRRRMKEAGWLPRPRQPARPTAGQVQAAQRLERREVRSFAAAHVNSLLHADFHWARRRVVDEDGRWHQPVLYAALDDCSRLCCHAQWYLAETAENHVHALTQAILKRGLPRQYMSDNGKPFCANEVVAGLERLAIVHARTLPYSAYQNGKQENFWAQVEGRLMAMLELVEPLTLTMLNRATSAWVELEYNRKVHREVGQAPLDRWLEGPDVGRPAPDGESLRQAFCQQQTRTQRKSDGTVSINGVRFEIPARMRHVSRLTLRYRGWDLSAAYLVDPRTQSVLTRIVPLDRIRNANARRRAIEPTVKPEGPPPGSASPPPMPALMQQLLDTAASSGLPPAYLPKDERNSEDRHE